MDRTTLTLAGLAAANLALWAWGAGPAPPDPQFLRDQVAPRERDLPAREAAAAWVARVRPLLVEPASFEPTAYLARLRALAETTGVELTEAAHRGGEPASLLLAGQGPFAGVMRIAEEAGAPASARLEGLDLAGTADGRLRFEVRLALRHGPWAGPPQAARGEPLAEPAPVRVTGPDPFAGAAPPLPAPATPGLRRALRYLGCHQGPGGTTVIVEDGTHAVLLRIGDRLPGGGRLVSADPARIGIEDEGGSRWDVAMETSR